MDENSLYSCVGIAGVQAGEEDTGKDFFSGVSCRLPVMIK